MDIFTHAVVGGVTGAAFGHPVAGAVAAVAPDFALWGRKRMALPPKAYVWAHSLFVYFIMVVVLAGVAAVLADKKDALFRLPFAILFAWLSHIVLDMPTHCAEWQPRLFPWMPETVAFADAQEWEFFNKVWFAGLVVSIIWSTPWLVVLFIQQVL